MSKTALSAKLEDATAKAAEIAASLKRSGGGKEEEAPSKKKSRWDDEATSFVVDGFHVHLASSGPPPAPIPGVREEEVKRIFVPQHAKGSVIGKGGETINRMRAETQAHVTIKQEEGDPSKTSATVTIKGTRAQVAHAEALVQERIRAAQKNNNADWQQRVVEVPKECIGETIGHGGCNLQMMSEKSGCKVKFVHATEVDPAADPQKQVCVIRGPPDKIKAAEMLVNARVTEVQQMRLNKRLQPTMVGPGFLPDGSPMPCQVGVVVPPMQGMPGAMPMMGMSPMPMGEAKEIGPGNPLWASGNCMSGATRVFAHGEGGVGGGTIGPDGWPTWMPLETYDPWGDDPNDDCWENWILPFATAFEQLIRGEVDIEPSVAEKQGKKVLSPSPWVMPEYRVIEKAAE